MLVSEFRTCVSGLLRFEFLMNLWPWQQLQHQLRFNLPNTTSNARAVGVDSPLRCPFLTCLQSSDFCNFS